MDIDVFREHELPVVFRVLRTSLRPTGPLRPQERAFLDTYARITTGERLTTDPQPIDASSVMIEGAHERKRLVQLAALAVLLSTPLQPEGIAFLKKLSHALTTHDPVIDVIEALHERRYLKVRMLAMRRAFRVMLKEAYFAEGAGGVVRFAAAMLLKAAVNKDKLWTYKRLGLLPEGTLGREYWKHMTTIGFGFPGEPGGIAHSVAYHDVGHVLTNYDTTPLGEIQQGSFQGGNRREDGFFFIQFVILQFHHAVRITPGARPQAGNFDPEKVLWAIQRGARCNVDMTHQWNYWPLMDLPLEEARARCALLRNLPPRALTAGGQRVPAAAKASSSRLPRSTVDFAREIPQPGHAGAAAPC